MCLQQPECAVISDTTALAPYGDLKNNIGSISGYGWAARFFQDYVNDKKILTKETNLFCDWYVKKNLSKNTKVI